MGDRNSCVVFVITVVVVCCLLGRAFVHSTSTIDNEPGAFSKPATDAVCTREASRLEARRVVACHNIWPAPHRKEETR